MLSNIDAIDIAFNGSKQFHQKLANANTEVTLDPVLPAHAVIADRLTKAAAWLQYKQPIKNVEAVAVNSIRCINGRLSYLHI